MLQTKQACHWLQRVRILLNHDYAAAIPFDSADPDDDLHRAAAVAEGVLNHDYAAAIPFITRASAGYITPRRGADNGVAVAGSGSGGMNDVSKPTRNPSSTANIGGRKSSIASLHHASPYVFVLLV